VTSSSYDRLLTALQLLASPAFVQCQYYEPHPVVVADEIALDYYEAFLVVETLRQTHHVTGGAYAALVDIDQRLDANSPHWQELRRQATVALALLR
jgi:hypothetical protein